MLKKVLICLLLGLTVLALPSASFAQDPNSDWQVILMDRNAGEILFISPSGTTRTAIPGYADFGTVYNPIISSDGQTLAFATTTNVSATEPALATIYLADLVSETCCTQLPDPLPAGADTVFLGGFSPDNTQLVAALAKANPSASSTGVSGIIATFNVADGSLAATLALSTLPQTTDIPITAAVFGRWTPEGIEIAPSCVACQQPTSGQYSIWDPATDNLTPTQNIFNQLWQPLSSTREAIFAAIDPTYPNAPDDQFMRIPSNVVHYFPTTTSTIDPLPIYNDPQNPAIKTVSWVLDAQAILVTKLSGTNGALVFRDGTQASVEIPETATFLAGTPDGWLMVNLGALQHYQFADNTLTVNEVGQITGFINILQGPPLGDPNTIGFLPILPPTP